MNGFYRWASMDDLPDVSRLGQFIVSVGFVLGLADIEGSSAFPNSVPKDLPRLSVVKK